MVVIYDSRQNPVQVQRIESQGGIFGAKSSTPCSWIFFPGSPLDKSCLLISALCITDMPEKIDLILKDPKLYTINFYCFILRHYHDNIMIWRRQINKIWRIRVTKNFLDEDMSAKGAPEPVTVLKTCATLRRQYRLCLVPNQENSPQSQTKMFVNRQKVWYELKC